MVSLDLRLWDSGYTKAVSALKKVLLDLTIELSDTAFFVFLSKSKLITVEGAQATVALENKAGIDWASNRLSDKIKKAVNLSLRAVGKEEVGTVTFISLDELVAQVAQTDSSLG